MRIAWLSQSTVPSSSIAGMVPRGFTEARNSGVFASRFWLVITKSKGSSCIRQVQTTARTGWELGTP